MNQHCEGDRNREPRFPAKSRYATGVTMVRNNPKQYSEPNLMNSLSVSASRSRHRYGSHGDKENYWNSNLSPELLSEDRMILFLGYPRNNTYHLLSRAKSFTSPGGNGHNLPEKQVHGNASSYNTLKRHYKEPPLSDDGYNLVIPHLDQGTSRERKRQFSYTVPSSSVENTLMFSQRNNGQRSFSQVSKGPPGLNGMESDGILVFCRKKASHHGLQRASHLMSVIDAITGKRASRQTCERNSLLMSSNFSFCEDLNAINSVPCEEAFDSSQCYSRSRVTMVPSPPTKDVRIRYRGQERSRSCASFNLRKPGDLLIVTAGDCRQKDIESNKEILAGQNAMEEIAMQINPRRKASKLIRQRESHFMSSIPIFCEDEENIHVREDRIRMGSIAALADIKPIKTSVAVDSEEVMPMERTNEEQEPFQTEKERASRWSSRDPKISSHNPTPSGKQLYHSHSSNSSSNADLPPVEEPLATECDAPKSTESEVPKSTECDVPKSTQTKCRRQAICIELEKTMNLVKLNGARMSLYDLRKDVCRLVGDSVFKKVHEQEGK